MVKFMLSLLLMGLLFVFGSRVIREEVKSQGRQQTEKQPAFSLNDVFGLFKVNPEKLEKEKTKITQETVSCKQVSYGIIKQGISSPKKEGKVSVFRVITKNGTYHDVLDGEGNKTGVCRDY